MSSVLVDPGSDYAFSMWVSSWFAQAPASLEFFFNGTSIGTFGAPATTGVWSEFATGWNSGADTALTIKIVDNTREFSGDDFALGRP